MAQEAANNELRNGDGPKAVDFSGFKPQVVFPAGKAEEALKFYKAAFGAEELNRVNHPKRKAEQDLPLIVSAELKIGTSYLIVGDQTGDKSSEVEGGGSGVIFRLETEDVASAVAKAVESGAVAGGEIIEVEGAGGVGLVSRLKDPFGIVWVIASADKKSSEPEA